MIFLLRHNEQQSTFGDPTAVTTIQTATLLLRSSKLHLRLSCDSFASKKTPGKALPSEIQVTIIGSCPDQLSPHGEITDRDLAFWLDSTLRGLNTSYQHQNWPLLMVSKPLPCVIHAIDIYIYIPLHLSKCIHI